MALISDGRYCRIAHITVDPETLSGSVRVDVFYDVQEFYALGESRVRQTYSVQWLRNANYTLDAYYYLLTLPEFANGVLDEEVFPDTGGVLSLGPRPSIHHRVVNGVWVAYLLVVRQQAKATITEARNTEEANGFLAYGKWFDSDKSAIQRISVAAQAAQVVGETFSIEWTCADNSTITLGYAQMLALPAIMAQAANVLHIKSRTLKDQIELATTIEEIESIVW